MFKYIFFLSIFIIHSSLFTTSFAQNPQNNFVAYQRSFKNVSDIFKLKEDTLKKQFEAKGLKWPAKYMYIRSFKYDSQLEIWVKNTKAEQFKLFKSYKICALAGTLGPKRVEGDFQVPEGFYQISEFNPKSNYDLALGVNYPNPSDRILGDSLLPGGDIYIHGSCVTVGCIPITNPQIEEVYTIAAFCHNEGQDYIPIHVFPIIYKNPKSKIFMDRILTDRPGYLTFAHNMKYTYYYFEKYKNLPVIMTNGKGNYVYGDNTKVIFDDEVKPVVYVKPIVPRREAKKVHFDESEIVTAVTSLPVYPGGAKEFQVFLDQLGKDLIPLLPEGRKKAYVQVEYIIDKEGNLINPKVLSGANNEMNNLIIDRFEALPKWTPAVRVYTKVPIRLQQTVEVIGE